MRSTSTSSPYGEYPREGLAKDQGSIIMGINQTTSTVDGPKSNSSVSPGHKDPRTTKEMKDVLTETVAAVLLRTIRMGFGLLQWNCRFIRPARTDPVKLISLKKPHVILLQEAWLMPKDFCSLSDYFIFRLD